METSSSSLALLKNYIHNQSLVYLMHSFYVDLTCAKVAIDCIIFRHRAFMFHASGLSMKNTARTTVREGKQSSNNT